MNPARRTRRVQWFQLPMHPGDRVGAEADPDSAAAAALMTATPTLETDPRRMCHQSMPDI